MLRLIIALLWCICAPGVLTAQQSIAIYTFPVQGLGYWDPDSVQKGITGSEEAVIYIGKELADMGYRVVVFGSPSPHSKYSSYDSNPRYLPVNQSDGTIFDIAIAWRQPDAGPRLRTRAHTVFLWPHDTLHMRNLTSEQVNAFDDVLWLSDWQRAQWMSVCPHFAKFTHIFGNGIVPDQFQPVTQRSNPYSCIYASNYARGLEVLLEAWPTVKARYPQATLDIYYGWQTWGLLTPEKEAKMRAQIESLPGVREHGCVGHDELNRAYGNASFWTYPCTAAEVFCISALRAQLAGAVPVIIDGSALTQVVPTGYKCASPSEYAATLLNAMAHAQQITPEQRYRQGDFVMRQYTWKSVAQQWKKVFDEQIALKTQQPEEKIAA